MPDKSCLRPIGSVELLEGVHIIDTLLIVKTAKFDLGRQGEDLPRT